MNNIKDEIGIHDLIVAQSVLHEHWTDQYEQCRDNLKEIQNIQHEEYLRDELERELNECVRQTIICANKLVGLTARYEQFKRICELPSIDMSDSFDAIPDYAIPADFDWRKTLIKYNIPKECTPSTHKVGLLKNEPTIQDIKKSNLLGDVLNSKEEAE